MLLELELLVGGRLREPAECEIKVRGRPITEFYRFLTRVQVETSREAASAATLVFESRRDEHGHWEVQDSQVLLPWEPITLEALFGNHREELFRGYIRELRATYPESAGAATVTVECQDESIALDREHVRRVWGGEAPTTDQQIVLEIASRYGLTVDPTSGAGMRGLTVPQDSPDIRFLRERAEANGYELLFRQGLLYFGPMRLEATPQPTILVYAGPDTHCRSLDIRTDGHRPESFAVDLPAEQGATTTRRTVVPDLPLMGTRPALSDPGLPAFTWLLSREGSGSEEEMVARAQRRANESAMRVRAEGELDGSRYGHVLLPGLPVSVDGVGEMLGGTYYVDSVSHEFTGDGYRQSFVLLRNALGEPPGGVGSSVLQGIL